MDIDYGSDIFVDVCMGIVCRTAPENVKSTTSLSSHPYNLLNVSIFVCAWLTQGSISFSRRIRHLGPKLQGVALLNRMCAYIVLSTGTTEDVFLSTI